MRTVRHLRSTAIAIVLGLATGGTAAAQDSMGGFDQAYTNGGNVFGHGAWGDGSGTAIPLPDPQIEYGFYFGRPYDGGNNLFGTGFWTSEYMVRRGETLQHDEAMVGDPVYANGPLGDGHAGDGGHEYADEGDEGGEGYGEEAGHGDGYDKSSHDKYGMHGGDDGHGKGGHDKGGYDKGGHDEGGYDKGGHKGGYDKGGKDKGQKDKHEKPKPPKHMKKPMPKEKVIFKTRFIPYARREVVVVPRSYTSVVVIERQEHVVELGHVEVTERQQVETFGAVCLTGKGDEVAAILVTDRSGDESYNGEIFRCPGDSMLRVSYATGSAEIVGSVRLEDGSSYKDCDGGDALVRTASGELVCAAKRRMSREAERDLAARYGGAEADVASSDDGYGYDDDAGGAEVDLSGLQLSGGVGNSGSGY